MARPGLMRHRKFARLERLLGSAVLARGHLELLWEVGYENGDDLVGDEGDLETLARWAGEPGVLAQALVASGFVDTSPEGLRIHDLWDHAPEYVRKRRHREAQRRQTGAGLSTMSSHRPPNGGHGPTDGAERSGADDGGDRAPPNGKTRAPAPAPAPAPSQPPSPPPARLAALPGGRTAANDEEGPASDDVPRADLRLVLLRTTLADQLGLPRMLGLGKNPDAVVGEFQRWLEAAGEELLVAECLRLAKERGETPANLSWWVGWLATVPTDRLRMLKAGRA